MISISLFPYDVDEALNVLRTSWESSSSSEFDSRNHD
jgi:hypothetical protein